MRHLGAHNREILLLTRRWLWLFRNKAVVEMSHLKDTIGCTTLCFLKSLLLKSLLTLTGATLNGVTTLAPGDYYCSVDFHPWSSHEYESRKEHELYHNKILISRRTLGFHSVMRVEITFGALLDWSEFKVQVIVDQPGFLIWFENELFSSDVYICW